VSSTLLEVVVEHDRTGLSDSEREAFEALTSSIGEVKVPRAASTMGALRRRRAVLSAVAAAVAVLFVVPLLTVSLWLGFAAFAAAVGACVVGCDDWMLAARRLVASLSKPSQPRFSDGRPWFGGPRDDRRR
jgi:hypothetical protein